MAEQVRRLILIGDTSGRMLRQSMNDKQFRFQDMKIWKRAAEFSPQLSYLADQLEQRRLFRFAEQLRGATLSITNNIAEGSGSLSEMANGYLKDVEWSEILPQLEDESKMLLAFIKTLRTSAAT